MKWIIVVAAAALIFSSVAPAEAAHVVVGRAPLRAGVVARVGVGPRVGVAAAPYWRANAVRFAGGWYYPGRVHPHWSITKFSPVYGRTIYYDPGLTTWFYWNAPVARYYPVSYIP
jgi:hypothetical protein